MTIYIVSYTSFESYDNYLYRDKKVFTDELEAVATLQSWVNSAWENITDEGERPESEIHIDRRINYISYERNDGYLKIIVELTEHEI